MNPVTNICVSENDINLDSSHISTDNSHFASATTSNTAIESDIKIIDTASTKRTSGYLTANSKLIPWLYIGKFVLLLPLVQKDLRFLPYRSLTKK